MPPLRARSRSKPSPSSSTPTPSSRPRRPLTTAPSASPISLRPNSQPPRPSSARLTRCSAAAPSPPTPVPGASIDGPSSAQPKSKKKTPKTMSLNTPASSTQPVPATPPNDSDSDLTALSDDEDLPSLAPQTRRPPRPSLPAPTRRSARCSLPAPPATIARTNLRTRLTPVAAAVPEKYSLEHMLADQARREHAQDELKRKREQAALLYGLDAADQVLLDGGLPGVCAELGQMVADGGGVSSVSDRQQKSNKKTRSSGLKQVNQAGCSADLEGQDATSAFPASTKALLNHDQASSALADMDLGASVRRVLIHASGSDGPSSVAASDDGQPVLELADVLLDSGVDDQEGTELVEEVVENINYGCTHPARFPTDLLSLLPPALSDPSTRATLHVLLIKLLFAPITDVRYPPMLARRAVYVLSDLARQTAGRLREAWAEALAAAFQALGVVLGSTEGPAESRAGGDGEAVVERVGMVLDVAETLVGWSCLDDDSLVWLFGAALQIGVDPRAAGLYAPTVGVVGRVLAGSPLALRKRLMARVLELAARLDTWANKLEMLRLVGPEMTFRRWAAFGVLGLASCDTGSTADETVAALVEWMAQISDGFCVGPPARELYNTIKHDSPRPYEPKDRAAATSAGARPRPRAGQFRPPFSLHSHNKKNEDDKLVLSDQQFSSMIEVYQMCFCGVWDYLMDSKNAGEMKRGGAVKVKNGISKEKGVGHDDEEQNDEEHDDEDDEDMDGEDQNKEERGQEDKGNVWVGSVAKNLVRLERLMKNNSLISGMSINEAIDEVKSGMIKNPEEVFKVGGIRVGGGEGGGGEVRRKLLGAGGIGRFNNQAERGKMKNVVLRLGYGLMFMNCEAYLSVKGVDITGQTKLTKYFC